MSNTSVSKSRAGSRIIEELRQLLLISLYLYVCLGALLLYTVSIAGAQQVPLAHFGYAAIKALVLGKFVLLGHWLHVGERLRNRPLIYAALYQSLVLWLFLIVLSALENLTVALFHDRSLMAAFAELLKESLFRIVAQSVILLLVLSPYVALRQFGSTMEPGALRRMFFSTRDDSRAQHTM
jgi:hypothetical protein